ncbi:NAD(P)-binding domain-containing protein [Geodermatophilus sabuli]|uniref:NAD(P)-binding domain-containing protein n=1 Tax=Geodermatophilus sabuli TaxID=1564158 RepID=A0A7K3VYK6_9ACTN|nr:NAD(P)-binding domain-containing protein [Geodermatophilus sabuli]NEK57725.1 NAD(P)-binding domain-containing protein [Geodermatophilus sabuli]
MRIGAVDVGGAVARGATEAGHSVTVTATDPTHAQALADQVGGTPAANAAAAAGEADAIVLAVTDHSGAEELQARLPGAHVMKAFDTVFASKQADPVADGTVLDGFYAGDDQQAESTVAELLAGIGFRAVDAGPLAQARALEHMAFLDIRLNASNGWPWQSGWELVGPTG